MQFADWYIFHIGWSHHDFDRTVCRTLNIQSHKTICRMKFQTIEFIYEMYNSNNTQVRVEIWFGELDKKKGKK